MTAGEEQINDREAEAVSLRVRMVASQLIARDITDGQVLKATS